MKTPDNNPYSEFSPSLSNRTEKNKGTKLKGFLIGWSLIVVSYALSALSLYTLLKQSTLSIEQALTGAIVCLFVPLLINSAVMVWHGLKGQRNTIIGNAISLASLVTAFLLLLAYDFIIIAS